MKSRKYNYRRNLPHIEKDDRPHFATFDTFQRWHLPPKARDLALAHCLHDNGSKMRLHVAVIMPDHVHMVFTPLRAESTETFTFEEILGAIKGASAHSINKALNRSGTVWQDESFDHVVRCEESFEEKVQYVCDNPVRKGLVSKAEDYKWLWKRPAKPNCKSPQPRAAVPHEHELKQLLSQPTECRLPCFRQRKRRIAALQYDSWQKLLQFLSEKHRDGAWLRDWLPARSAL